MHTICARWFYAHHCHPLSSFLALCNSLLTLQGAGGTLVKCEGREQESVMGRGIVQRPGTLFSQFSGGLPACPFREVFLEVQGSPSEDKLDYCKETISLSQ